MDNNEGPSPSDLLQLWENVVLLFHSLPSPNSSFRHELVNLLLPGISRGAQRALSGIHAEATLSMYVNNPPDQNRLGTTRYAQGTSRNRSEALVDRLVGELEEKYGSSKSGDQKVRRRIGFFFLTFFEGPSRD